MNLTDIFFLIVLLAVISYYYYLQQYSKKYGTKKWHVYAIKNKTKEIVYIGHTSNPEKRIIDHKKEKVHGKISYKMLGNNDSLEVLHSFKTRKEAMSKEHELIIKHRPKRNKRSYKV